MENIFQSWDFDTLNLYLFTNCKLTMNLNICYIHFSPNYYTYNEHKIHTQYMHIPFLLIKQQTTMMMRIDNTIITPMITPTIT